MGLWDSIFGKKDSYKKLSTLTPEQEQSLLGVLDQLQNQQGVGGNYQLGQDYINKILSGDPEAFNRFAAPLKRQFQEETIPNLSRQFAGYGGGLGGGVGNSSGFGQALGSAGAQYQSNLDALYAQIQQNAANSAFGNYQNLANTGLGTRGFENAYQPGYPGLVGNVVSGVSQGVGGGIGLGGTIGLSQRIASMFNKSPNSNQATGTGGGGGMGVWDSILNAARRR